jgi:hypothetical protein
MFEYSIDVTTFDYLKLANGFFPLVLLAGKHARDNKLTKVRAFCKLTRDGASCIVFEKFRACCTPQVGSVRSMGSPCASFDRLGLGLSLTFVNTSTYYLTFGCSCPFGFVPTCSLVDIFNSCVIAPSSPH